MTNKSFLFRTGDHHCICRIPGPGTELLINREQEKEVYDAIRPLGHYRTCTVSESVQWI